MTARTVMAFDFGTTSIGIAVGQEITATASPATALKARDGQPQWQQIATLLQEWQPQLLIVGLPLNMDGSAQPITHLARKFANRLRGRFSLSVQLQDERLTTAEAKSSLFAGNNARAVSKARLDAMAAVIILESWFEQQRQNSVDVTR